MSEAELTAQWLQISELTLGGLSVFFTVVSAYIVALFYFLYRAPAAMRIGAFLLVTFAIALLAVMSVTTVGYSEAVEAALRELNTAGPLSLAGAFVIGTRTGVTDTVLQAGLWTGLAAIYGVLVYLTFFYRWRADSVRAAAEPRGD